MSVYLKLLVLSGPSDLLKTSVLPQDIISVEQDYDLMGQLGNLGGRTLVQQMVPSQPLPPHLWLETAEGEKIRVDEYDSPLQFFYAGDFQMLVMPESGVSPRTRAIKLFLEHLPPDTPIILFWQ